MRSSEGVEFDGEEAVAAAANRIYVASGFGLKVSVDRGHLAVHDGIGRQRRTVRLNRATSRLRRLVVLGHSGYVTLEALRWLRDVGAAFVQIDRDGKLVACTAGYGRDDARLRRAQALAASNGVGLEITRELLKQKLHGQAATAEALPDSDAKTNARLSIDRGLVELEHADTLEQLRLLEAQAARDYFAAWGDVPTRYTSADHDRVPEHWHRFDSRISPLTSANRSAANPANAILNYLFALIEAEASLACHAVGLDPGIGLLHADQKARDSLALDLMEPIRPEAERHLLTLLDRNAFRARDFHETRTGNCRLQPTVARKLAETLPTWMTLIAPVAETVARHLAHAAHITSPPTPLTNANRKAGKAAVRRRPTPARRAKPPQPLAGCWGCGGETPHPDRLYCNDCLPDYRQEQFEQRFSGSGMSKLAQLSAQGIDSTHGGQAAERRGQTIADRKQAIREWERQFGKVVDLTVFRAEILPLVQEVPLSRLVKATGLSLRYCSQIRRGEKVPHPRHWHALVAASEE